MGLRYIYILNAFSQVIEIYSQASEPFVSRPQVTVREREILPIAFYFHLILNRILCSVWRQTS